MGRHLMGAFQFLKSMKCVALYSVTLSYGRGRRCSPNRDDANCQKGHFDSDIHSLLLSSFSQNFSLHIYLAIRNPPRGDFYVLHFDQLYLCSKTCSIQI